MKTTLLTPSLQNKSQPGGWKPTGSQGSPCFAGDHSKISCARTSRAAPALVSSISPTFLPPAPAPVGNKMKITSAQIGPKELCQGERARVFNYTNFTLVTYVMIGKIFYNVLCPGFCRIRCRSSVCCWCKQAVLHIAKPRQLHGICFPEIYTFQFSLLQKSS